MPIIPKRNYPRYRKPRQRRSDVRWKQAANGQRGGKAKRSKYLKEWVDKILDAQLVKNLKNRGIIE